MQSKKIFRDLFKHIEIGIGEVSKITGVTQRQLRYWEEKGYIEPLSTSKGVRSYNLQTVILIAFLKDQIDEGYTLAAAVKKSEQTKQKMRMLSEFMREANKDLEVINDQDDETSGIIKFGEISSDNGERFELEGIVNPEEKRFVLKKNEK